MFFRVKMMYLDLKFGLLRTKNRIRLATLNTQYGLRTKWFRTVKKANTLKRKAKDAIIPALPGISKVRLPEPPVLHLVRSNQPPTEAEMLLIVDAIEKAEAEAKHLSMILEQRRENRETSRSWEMATIHKIGQANRFARRHRGLLSPVRKLPPEILQEIFSWSADYTAQQHPRWRYNVHLSWGLGQVCKTWRMSALVTSALWRLLPTIHLRKSNAKTKLQFQYLSELIRRSRGATLDICIYANSFDRETHPVVDLLSQYAERWEALRLEIAPPTMASFRSIKGRLSSLKTLKLEMQTLHLMPGLVDYFAVAPLLTTVSLTPPFSREVILPYAQLVHYTERLSDRMGSRISKVITSPILETLTILELDDAAVFPVVTLPLLTKLEVRFQYRSQQNCFDNLTIPAVEDIRVVSTRGSLMASLIAMLSKSYPTPLKTLSLRLEIIGHNELTTLLALTPTLLSLDVTLPSFNSDINHLASGYQNQHLVPLLETCEFFIEDNVSQDGANALNAVATARCEPGDKVDNVNFMLPGELRPLKNLSITFDGSIWTHSLHAHLENWTTTDTSAELTGLREQLYARIPELASGRSSVHPRKFDLGWNDKVNRILVAIESVKVDDVRDIYVSRLHYSLKILSQGWKASSHSDQAQRILDKWHPLIEGSLKDRHWAFKGPYSMMYIANDNALRTSEDSMTIVFGLKEQITFASVYWPIFMQTF